jgi:hypothetical protein
MPVVVARQLGWWVGLVCGRAFCGRALLIMSPPLDTGIPGYVWALSSDLFGVNWHVTAPNDILALALVLLAIQTLFNLPRVNLPAAQRGSPRSSAVLTRCLQGRSGAPGSPAGDAPGSGHVDPEFR